VAAAAPITAERNDKPNERTLAVTNRVFKVRKFTIVRMNAAE